MKNIPNEMILASAGSGKTYALTTRFIMLLAAGVAPERIAALTFTRKAAGEFFDGILTRLADAASEPMAASELAGEVGQPGLDCAGFGALLRGMIDAMPRLTLGTMDSFFARVVSAFPFELGLSGEMRMLDEAQAAEETRRVLARFFTATHRGGKGQDAVLEAFRFATIGVESKSVAGVLDGFISEYMELFRRNSSPEAWGGRARIWPDGFPWTGSEAEAAEALRVLCEWMKSEDSMTDGQRKRWRDFAEAYSGWAPGMTWPGPLRYVMTAVLKAGPDFENATVEITIERRKQIPPGEVCGAIASLVRRVMGLELGRRMAVTQGIGSLLRQFDATYDAQVRRSGRLTFSDVLELLGSSEIISGGRSRDGARGSIDFRLDGRIDHWLLDEFQDTSRRQWDVLENLIDEAVQDPSGTRSLFYVGDVKQAIFSWRGGDPRLFEHVAARYSTGGSRRIERRELNRSYRSGEAIVELVNRVFGSKAIGEVLPGAAWNWKGVWREHESAVPNRVGQAAVLIAADENVRRRTMLELIREIDPIRRGFSCAVLVQKNSTATEIAEFLRREGGLPAVAESDLHIGKDNPWSSSFVSLLRCASHPGDSMSWEHLKMTPVWDWLNSVGVQTQDTLSRRILDEIGSNGYESLAMIWTEGMTGAVDGIDSFTELRASQLIASAREFDNAGGGTVAAFIRWMEDATVRETEGTDVVRVMTIHKSKGLGFDVVILPDLEGSGLAARRDGPAVGLSGDGEVDWVLEFPGNLVAEHDERLRAYLSGAQSDAAFDSLARLYVAMTRAKRGLFAIIEPPGRSVACSYPRLLQECLGSSQMEVQVGSRRFDGLGSTGDSSWLADRASTQSASEWAPEFVSANLRVNRPVRRVASRTEEDRRDAAAIFASDLKSGASRGISIHELLAEIEWIESLDADSWAERALSRGMPVDAVEEATSLLRAPDTKKVFENPGEGWEAWRERSFEALIDGAWVSAVIDRVCVRSNAEGVKQEAVIYDFKTGRITSSGELTPGVVDQLEMYSKVLAAATGLPRSRVSINVVLTPTASLIPIGAGGSPD